MSASISRKHALSAVVVGLALAFGASAQTTQPSTAAGSTKSSTTTAAKKNPDHSFVEKAAMGGMLEQVQRGAAAAVERLDVGFLRVEEVAGEELEQRPQGRRMAQRGGKLGQRVDRRFRRIAQQQRDRLQDAWIEAPAHVSSLMMTFLLVPPSEF